MFPDIYFKKTPTNKKKTCLLRFFDLIPAWYISKLHGKLQAEMGKNLPERKKTDFLKKPLFQF